MEDSKFIRVGVGIIVVVVAGVVLRLAKPALIPLFLAFFLSLIVSPVMNFFTRHKIPRFVSVVVILLATFLLVYFLGSMLYSSGKAFADEIPAYSQKLMGVGAALEKAFHLPHSAWNLQGWIEHLNFNRIASILLSSLGTFFSFISDVFLVLLFLLFILASRGRMTQKIPQAFDPERSSRILDVLGKIDCQMQKYLAIKTLMSLVNGLVIGIVLLIFGVPFAVLFGVLNFLLNYIPTIGSIIGTTLPVLIAALQFDSLWPAFWLLIILMGLQMLMGNWLEPKLMGTSLGMSPLLVLFALFFWGWLWGIPGMILAVPIMAILQIIFKNIPSLNFLAALMEK